MRAMQPLAHFRPSPWLILGRHRIAWFQVWACIGILVAIVQSFALAGPAGISRLTTIALACVALTAFWVQAVIVRIITCRESHVFYRQSAGILVATVLFCQIAHQPILPCLDIASMSLMSVDAFGRLGCLSASCCHGRPCRFGIRYTGGHLGWRCSANLIGAPLFPIQAVESAFVLGVVIWGTKLMLEGSPPGTALSLYFLVYGMGRFLLEFARGDRERKYLWGFSEAQWTSVLLCWAIVAAEWAKILPMHRWHWVCPAVLSASIASLASWWHLDSQRIHQLRYPHHVWEIVTALNHLERVRESAGPGSRLDLRPMIHVACTSQGYRLSLGALPAPGGSIRHFSVSSENRPLSLNAVRTIARLISHVGPAGPFTIVPGGLGVYHILFGASAESLGRA